MEEKFTPQQEAVIAITCFLLVFFYLAFEIFFNMREVKSLDCYKLNRSEAQQIWSDCKGYYGCIDIVTCAWLRGG